MPFIDSKITVSVSEEKRQVIREALCQSMTILNKPASFLMIGFEDNYDLSMGGKKLEKGAYVTLSLFGDGEKSSYEEMTALICDLYEKELEIPKDAVYITYHGIHDWGWNGRNF